MAETTVSPNNIKIAFSGKPTKERKMPVVSKVQNAAMHAAAEGKSTLGIPKKVGQEFTGDQEPGSVKDLPERVAKPKKKSRLHQLAARGLVSAKQQAKAERKTGGESK